MMLEESIFALLTNDTEVVALVGTKVFPLVIPQKTSLPAITYQRISTVNSNALEGTGQLTRVRLQIDCWAMSYATVKAMRGAVRAAMIEAGHLAISDRDDFDDEINVYNSSMDFSLLA